jgi:phosphotransferase system IIB component
LVIAVGVCAAASQVQAQQQAALDTARIEQITGLKGTFSKQEDVFKITKPRDVKVQVDGWTMPPFMGLTSYAAFKPAHDSQVMMMGDTVLFEDEVNPAMSAALDAGLEVTALHNHFFFDQPKVYFMHIGGHGDAGKLADGVRKVYDRIAEVRAAHANPESTFPRHIADQSSISAAPLEAVFGTKGQTNNGMFKVIVGRTASMHGVTVGNEMGVNTWAAFAGTDDEAVVDGDFAMREGELQTVLKSMRASGINIVAIHQHMTGETPRILFLHYWGKGKAADLTRGVKAALDAQGASAR